MNTKAYALVVVLTAIALGACGGGGGGANPAATTATDSPATAPIPAPTRTTGTVAVLLTDAPGSSWNQAWATISSITLIGSAGHQTIFSGSETVDLLSLPDFSEVFAISDEVAPGTVDKIRLIVDKLKLVDLDSEGNTVRSVMARLVGNGKIDLDPSGSVVVGAGDTLFIEIDFDMHKSFKTTQTGNGDVIVRPVVRVQITRQEPLARLTRLRGVIEEIDAEAQSFLLCQSGLVAAASHVDRDYDDDEVRRCVDVATDDLTGFFGADGAPVAFADLKVDDELTAIGRLEGSDNADGGEDEDDDGEDEGDDDRHDGKNKNKKKGNHSNNGERYGDHSGHSSGCNHYDELVLQAVMVEVGDEFARVAGTADTAVTNDEFDLAVEPGQDLGTSEEVLATTLYPETRIFNARGEELDASAITEGVGVLADGVLVSSEGQPDSLRAALLILDPDSEQEQSLRGDILAIDLNTGQLRLLTGGTEQCVAARSADIFLVSNNGGLLTERGTLADLVPGQTADFFGTAGSNGDCFVATDVIVDSQSGNTAPVANAGGDVTVTAGQSVTLSGSTSSDADGDALTYRWTLTTKPTDSTATLSGADTATASFTADKAGQYVAELIVSDAFGDSAPDTVTVTAN